MTEQENRERFENWARLDSPKWPTDRKPNGDYLHPLTQRFWREWIAATPPCEHGAVGYCGLCEAKAAPRCEAHGNPWFCGHCGPVRAIASRDDMRV